MTFKADIELVANGEPIESIIVGPFGWAYNDESDEDSFGFGSRKPIPQELKNKPVAWEEVADYLDYKYSQGYGHPECHAIYAYTSTKIIFVSTYDGSTSVLEIPRNPHYLLC